ncbi:hypothetical protein KM043_016676 [Ampulex compressa]|nr:hypothetical protein KM043_016676 [Ampulex compressa]
MNINPRTLYHPPRLKAALPGPTSSINSEIPTYTIVRLAHLESSACQGPSCEHSCRDSKGSKGNRGCATAVKLPRSIGTVLRQLSSLWEERARRPHLELRLCLALVLLQEALPSLMPTPTRCEVTLPYSSPFNSYHEYARATRTHAAILPTARLKDVACETMEYLVLNDTLYEDQCSGINVGSRGVLFLHFVGIEN